MREASKGSIDLIISKIAKAASMALNKANANGCRTTPRRARSEKTHGAAGRRRDQNPHRPHPRARRRKFSVFSAPIYIRGSVKNYATMLRLDVPQITAALDAELKGTKKFSEPPPLVEASRSPLDQVMFLLSKVNGKVALAGGGILVIVLVVMLAGWAWRHRKSSDAPPNLPPAVYQPASSGDTLPLPK